MNRYATDAAPPKTNYTVVPCPYPFPVDREGDAVDVYNLQVCMCGHDRCCHSDYLGHGKKRVFVTNVAYAGHCSLTNCECERFVFSNARSSPDGKKRRALEKKSKKIVPPEAQIKKVK